MADVKDAMTAYECEKHGVRELRRSSPPCDICGRVLKPIRLYREDAFSIEHRTGDDGSMGWPPSASDRPSTHYRRLVGRWQKA